MSILAAAAAAAAASALWAAWRLSRRLQALWERLGAIEERLERLEAAQRLLDKAVAAALASSEAEDMLEKLRRRRRRRYIVFYVVTEDGRPPPPEEVEKAILKATERLAGQLTVALARLQLVYYHPDTGAGILRASHDTKHLVLAAMALVRRIGGSRAILVPVRTTGTIRTAKRVLGLRLRELKKT